ncbi:hypothetical protein ILYODFUR_028453, partial [Ilyodon furcidens]
TIADTFCLLFQTDDVFKAAPTPLSPTPAPSTPVTPATSSTSASSASSGTPSTPSSISPSGIVKRKTARKMLPKRKLDESESGSESQKGESEVAEEQGQQNKRPRVESVVSGAGMLYSSAASLITGVTSCAGLDGPGEQREVGAKIRQHIE